MSFRGGGGGRGFPPRGGGGFRGGGDRGGFRGGGGGRGGFVQEADPPEYTERVGDYMHPCEDCLMYFYSKAQTVSRFNANVYTEKKVKIGRIDDVTGTTTNIMFSVIPERDIDPKSLKRAGGIRRTHRPWRYHYEHLQPRRRQICIVEGQGPC